MRGGVAFVDTGPMPQARRTQRAETIGAVLRSIVAVVIWSIAVAHDPRRRSASTWRR